MLSKTVSKKIQKKKELKNKKHAEKNSQPAASENMNYNSLIKRFNDFYDDSSDEEDIDEKIKRYDAGVSWKAVENDDAGRKTFTQEDLFSFVAHAAGIKALHHKKISEKYYALKCKLLQQANEDALSQLRKLVKDAISVSVASSFSSLKQFLSIAEPGSKSREMIYKVMEQAESDFNEKLDEFVKVKSELFIMLFKLQKSEVKNKSAKILADFSDELAAGLMSTIQKLSKPQEMSFSRAAVKKDLQKLAEERLLEIMIELGIDKNSHTDGKNKSIAALEQQYKGPFQNLSQKGRLILSKCPGSGYVVNMLFKYIAERSLQAELMSAYLKDLIFMRESKKYKKYLSESEKTNFEKYCRVDASSLVDEFKCNFNPLLKVNLENSFKSFYRPTFGRSHTFVSKNPYEFYANIRLANRSQKRQIKNLQNTIFKHDYCTRLWKMVDVPLPRIEVCESQQILDASFGRKDMIEGLGNYEKVIDFINQIKNYFKDKDILITDSGIASWIRSIFRGVMPDINLPQIDAIVLIQKLQSITYLLLGCECVRNPAMIVINQMLLDLIIDNLWSFEDAFDVKQNNRNGEMQMKIMPMAPKGAVSVARALESSYRKYMPYPYFYRGIEESEKKNNKFHMHDLINAEARIVRDWINLKSELPSKITKSQLANWILNLIENYFSLWFDPDKNELTTAYSLEKKLANLKI